MSRQQNIGQQIAVSHLYMQLQLVLDSASF